MLFPSPHSPSLLLLCLNRINIVDNFPADEASHDIPPLSVPMDNIYAYLLSMINSASSWGICAWTFGNWELVNRELMLGIG